MDRVVPTQLLNSLRVLFLHRVRMYCVLFNMHNMRCIDMGNILFMNVQSGAIDVTQFTQKQQISNFYETRSVDRGKYREYLLLENIFTGQSFYFFKTLFLLNIFSLFKMYYSRTLLRIV